MTRLEAEDVGADVRRQPRPSHQAGQPATGVEVAAGGLDDLGAAADEVLRGGRVGLVDEAARVGLLDEQHAPGRHAPAEGVELLAAAAMARELEAGVDQIVRPGAGRAVVVLAEAEAQDAGIGCQLQVLQQRAGGGLPHPRLQGERPALALRVGEEVESRGGHRPSLPPSQSCAKPGIRTSKGGDPAATGAGA